MDVLPVDGIDQDSAALYAQSTYVAAVNKSSLDVYPSCDLCRHAFRLWATCNMTECT